MTSLKVDLDAMIEYEKKQVALEYQSEAWAGGMSDGIELEIMAEAAIATAVSELVEAAGEQWVLSYIEELKERIVAGAFVEKTLQ